MGTCLIPQCQVTNYEEVATKFKEAKLGRAVASHAMNNVREKEYRT